MGNDEYQDIVRIVNSEVGDGFRTAFRYDAREWTALYVRNDIATRELRQTIETLIDRGRSHDPIITPDSYDRLGSEVATIEVHEYGTLLHLHEAGKQAIGVTIDRDVDVDVLALATRLRDVLHGKR